LFGHVITRRSVCSAATSTAYFPITTYPTLAFETAAVTHSRKVFVVIPYLCKFLFEHVTAFYRQIPTGKYVSLMAYEQHTKACKAST
ncbi:unnamed protein product, partial [marine sediment metagenome]